MSLEQTWRWYGPNDPISLQEIKQTGATGIVSALHHIPNGEVWTIKEIKKRIAEIEAVGLRWSVVESVPVHEDIKKRTWNFKQYIENYKESIKNLGACGIETICYNFMPVLDWSRTDLAFESGDGSNALKFDIDIFAAFDVFILKRENSRKDYSEAILKRAEAKFKAMSAADIEKITRNVIAGLPGAEESYTLESFQKVLDGYKGIGAVELKKNLHEFLREIIPVAEQAGVRMAIHPDDPPRALLGLPRVVSTIEDAIELTKVIDSVSNGITLCTGSFGAGHFNDLPEMTKILAPRINFVHLRNVKRDAEGNFEEEYLFDGDIDIPAVMRALLVEEKERKESGRKDWQMPMRPDHGNKMLDDLPKKTNPGYSLYGRMKGLAELRGLEQGLMANLK
ncbi:mannonate dehydratase [Ancylomarina sp. 16SWW S1-10-2]|uniref:mannonate dehydratase n=1 Tax=Ancylomarina sp. 16SWW S1-10-2 TaxID=2499681 RepID=UPI0012AD4BF0|nr:mannonate dehydratase [Ancylomarina sp. 16SWW S1-10-2]MRT93983.1 mannonate dehydratase [Ancylomarina sp. 16SWW S1-10-2]